MSEPTREPSPMRLDAMEYDALVRDAMLWRTKGAQAQRALDDCRMLAARHSHKTGAEWAEHILRFCASAGVVGSPLRDAAIAAERGQDQG